MPAESFKYGSLAQEWHPTRNGSLQLHEIPRGAQQQLYWWRCRKKAHHSWQASFDARAAGASCAICRLERRRTVADAIPDSLPMWHPTRNGSVSPDDVAYRTMKKVWWRCTRNPEHEWQARPYQCSHSTGRVHCPYCKELRASRDNNLAVRFPEIAKLWHPTRNRPLTPEQVTSARRKPVWWRCEKGHVWKDSVWQRVVSPRRCIRCVPAGDRTTKAGTPVGRRLAALELVDGAPPRERTLAKLAPELAEQWHPTRNGSLGPSDFSPRSSRMVWWRCPAGPDHEWQEAPSQRFGRTGCPFCAQRRLSVTNMLGVVAPALAREWHSTKNGRLTPIDVPYGSHRRVWWKCPAGPDHEWETEIRTRAVVGHGCPFCSGRRTSITNCLANLYPLLAAEWHPTRNGRLTPSQITTRVTRKVWWRCSKDFTHEWQKPVVLRTRGVGCPFCRSNGTPSSRLDHADALGPQGRARVRQRSRVVRGQVHPRAQLLSRRDGRSST